MANHALSKAGKLIFVAGKAYDKRIAGGCAIDTFTERAEIPHMEETIDELFPNTAYDVRAILVEIRRVVRDALPDATETLYHGALGYGQTPSGFERILYIAPQNGYVNLGFFFGAGVADPAGLLEGSGKRMRHIKIRTVPAAQNPALIPMMREAWQKGVVAFAQYHEERKKRHPIGVAPRHRP